MCGIHGMYSIRIKTMGIVYVDRLVNTRRQSEIVLPEKNARFRETPLATIDISGCRDQL